VEPGSYNGYVWLTPTSLLFLPASPRNRLAAKIWDIRTRSLATVDLARDNDMLDTVAAKLRPLLDGAHEYLDVDSSYHVGATGQSNKEFPPADSTLVSVARSLDGSCNAYIVKTTQYNRWQKALKHLIPGLSVTYWTNAYLWVGDASDKPP
jgi:hypothetical protein